MCDEGERKREKEEQTIIEEEPELDEKNDEVQEGALCHLEHRDLLNRMAATWTVQWGLWERKRGDETNKLDKR